MVLLYEHTQVVFTLCLGVEKPVHHLLDILQYHHERFAHLSYGLNLFCYHEERIYQFQLDLESHVAAQRPCEHDLEPSRILSAH